MLVFDGLLTKIYAKNAAETVSLDKSHTFAQSENVVRCLYCKDSGELPTSACSHDLRGHRLEYGYFKKGTEPTSRCDTHILVDYDSKTNAVAAEHCPSENIIRVALLKYYNRSFPCEITVTDAQYIYRHLPYGAEPSASENEAFFQDFYESAGNYIGVAGAKQARNRYCTEHEHPPEEMTDPTETEGTEEKGVKGEQAEFPTDPTESESSEAAREERTDAETTPAETTPIQPRETEAETKKKKRFIGWFS